MEAIPKSDIKSVIKSDIRFDISIKQTTWIGHLCISSLANSPICKMTIIFTQTGQKLSFCQFTQLVTTVFFFSFRLIT